MQPTAAAGPSQDPCPPVNHHPSAPRRRSKCEAANTDKPAPQPLQSPLWESFTGQPPAWHKSPPSKTSGQHRQPPSTLHRGPGPCPARQGLPRNRSHSLWASTPDVQPEGRPFSANPEPESSLPTRPKPPPMRSSGVLASPAPTPSGSPPGYPVVWAARPTRGGESRGLASVCSPTRRIRSPATRSSAVVTDLGEPPCFSISSSSTIPLWSRRARERIRSWFGGGPSGPPTPTGLAPFRCCAARDFAAARLFNRCRPAHREPPVTTATLARGPGGVYVRPYAPRTGRTATALGVEPIGSGIPGGQPDPAEQHPHHSIVGNHVVRNAWPSSTWWNGRSSPDSPLCLAKLPHPAVPHPPPERPIPGGGMGLVATSTPLGR